MNIDSNVTYRVEQGNYFELRFTDHILDNVYGHIGITAVERKL